MITQTLILKKLSRADHILKLVKKGKFFWAKLIYELLKFPAAENIDYKRYLLSIFIPAYMQYLFIY